MNPASRIAQLQRRTWIIVVLYGLSVSNCVAVLVIDFALHSLELDVSAIF
jgi:hypothetical protein